MNRVFEDEDIHKIAETVHLWRQDRCASDGKEYEDAPGFCKSDTVEEIAEHDFVLTPGRYVGAEEVEGDEEEFAEKMERLTAQLTDQMAKGAEMNRSSGNGWGRWAMSSDWPAPRADADLGPPKRKAGRPRMGMGVYASCEHRVSLV